MARLVKVHATGPIKIEVGSLRTDKPTFICACGLSQTMPFCDGRHKITRSEQPGTVYVYGPDGQTVVQQLPDLPAPSGDGNSCCQPPPSETPPLPM